MTLLVCLALVALAIIAELTWRWLCFPLIDFGMPDTPGAFDQDESKINSTKRKSL